jgi:hypothetical protein
MFVSAVTVDDVPHDLYGCMCVCVCVCVTVQYLYCCLRSGTIMIISTTVAGMPILLVFGCASAIMTYWVDKYLMLRFYSCAPLPQLRVAQRLLF